MIPRCFIIQEKDICSAWNRKHALFTEFIYYVNPLRTLQTWSESIRLSPFLQYLTSHCVKTFLRVSGNVSVHPALEMPHCSHSVQCNYWKQTVVSVSCHFHNVREYGTTQVYQISCKTWENGKKNLWKDSNSLLRGDREPNERSGMSPPFKDGHTSVESDEHSRHPL